MNVLKFSAVQLMELYRSKKLSPIEVLDSLINELPRIDLLTNAFLATDFDAAMDSARISEKQWLRGEPTGLLCGVPISVKDSIEVSGMFTTYGSLAYKNNQQPDGLLVKRLRENGAIIFGKTNLPEFALRPEVNNLIREPGRNPWNLDRTCGGSSGGSAVAVATGLGPISIGTDSGGSIRGPSAQNAVFGFKPSYQRVPTVQTWRAAVGRSHNGPITRTVADCVLTMRAMSGFDVRDQESLTPHLVNPNIDPSDVKNLRIGVVKSDITFAEGEDVMVALGSAHDLLKDNNFSVVYVDEPPTYSPLHSKNGIWPYGADHLAASQTMLGDNFLEEHGAKLTDYAFKVYSEAKSLCALDYRLAQLHDTRYRHTMQSWLLENNIDLLIMKCVPPAPLIDEAGRVLDRDSNGLAMFNISRLPVASIPVGFFKKSMMPLGLQVVGRFGQDCQVLGIALFFEMQGFWNFGWPTLAVSL